VINNLAAVLADSRNTPERVMTDQKLKPCPFCGASHVNDTDVSCLPSVASALFDDSYNWVCPDCACSGPAGVTIEEATELWNQRQWWEA